ncbi:ABC transporter ATP-binding protein [Geobacter luticola]|uniref:ABC transporter ATP-binding protein n=1 Tax=Geomobilimonas luticola TaxID=1114878 RepID=A0ABS5SDK6_9BACT|nr:ABC transporter ATP-binding protein [Geomobilimonas luticola]MBT0653454.1 ABC transporter ATP-binding protein [Geomobilimonas luticola]
MLAVSDLNVRYGKVEAIYKASINVDRGTIVSVIGPNGAGKTTLLNAIMGVLPSQGGIEFCGANIGRLTTEQRVAKGMCLVPESRELFAQMSVADNLELGAFTRYRRGDKGIKQSLDEVYELFPRLLERRTQLAGSLSGGERQMLALGRALMSKPTLLMLDEPSLGLAPLIVKEILHNISNLRSTGVSILLIEQNARAALQISDYGYVLENGDIAMEGLSKELANDPKVIESYLGMGGAGQDRDKK